MLEGIDHIDWASLEHAYGDASDIPDLLRRLSQGEAGVLDTLSGNVFHQGTRYSASPAIVPFLVEILRASGSPELTRGILEYLHGLALGFPTDLFPRPIDAEAWEAQLHAIDRETLRDPPPEKPRDAYERWRRMVDGYWATTSYFAVEAVIEDVARFVSHDDPAIASAACALVASVPRAKGRTVPALIAALDRDLETRGAALVAIAHLGETTPHTRASLALEGDDEAHALLRLHAAVAIAIGPEPIDDTAIATLTAPLGSLAKRESCFAGTMSALVSAALMHVPPIHREAVVHALVAQHEDADGLTCLQLSRDLLELVFPARAPTAAKELTPLQRTAIEAIVRSRGWQWGNYSSLMKAFGLPTKKDELATWLART